MSEPGSEVCRFVVSTCLIVYTVVMTMFWGPHFGKLDRSVPLCGHSGTGMICSGCLGTEKSKLIRFSCRLSDRSVYIHARNTYVRRRSVGVVLELADYSIARSEFIGSAIPWRSRVFRTARRRVPRSVSLWLMFSRGFWLGVGSVIISLRWPLAAICASRLV